MVNRWTLLAGAAALVAAPVIAQDAEGGADAPMGEKMAVEVAEADAPLMYEGEPVYEKFEELDVAPRWRSGDTLEDLPGQARFEEEKRGQRLVASAILLKDGSLTRIELEEPTGVEEIDAAALERLSGWKLNPARLDGEPVYAKIRVTPWIGYWPQRVEGEVPELPEEAKALGHNGTTRIKGTVAPDGSFVDVELLESSNSDIIDAAVLAAVAGWRFDPPVRLDGEPHTIENSYSFPLSQVTGGTGSMSAGLRDYTCSAFVAEYDWWRSVNPEAEPDDYNFRKFFLGLNVIGSLGGTVNVEAFKSMMSGFDRKWDKAVERCRKKPQEKFVRAFRKS